MKEKTLDLEAKIKQLQKAWQNPPIRDTYDVTVEVGLNLDNPNHYTEFMLSKSWVTIWDETEKHETTDGIRYISDDGYPLMYSYDPINFFWIDNKGWLRWCSPASEHDKVKSNNMTIVRFLDEHEFQVLDVDGYIKAGHPMTL